MNDNLNTKAMFPFIESTIRLLSCFKRPHLVTGPKEMVFLADAVVHEVLEAGVHLQGDLLCPGAHGGHPLRPHPTRDAAHRPQHHHQAPDGEDH